MKKLLFIIFFGVSCFWSLSSEDTKAFQSTYKPANSSDIFIENARILLHNNIGNENDQVGRYLMNHPKPVAVTGSSANIFGHFTDGEWDPEQFNVEDFGTALIRFEGGITLFFAHSWAINFREQWQIRIAGNRGSAEIYPFANPKLRLMHGGYSDLTEFTPADLPEGSTDINYEIKQFVNAIENKLPSPIPSDTFLYTNLIFDAIYQSTNLGHEVKINTPDFL